MKNQIILLFIFFTSITFSQKITGKILDSETKEPIERAHVFFINKTIYTNSKGEFSFNLKNENIISFSVSHLKYETQKINFTLNKTPLVIYLHEKQETLDGIKISTNKKYKSAIEFKKLQDLPKAVYSFASVLNNNKIYVFGGDVSSKQEKNKEGLEAVQFSNELEIMRFLQKPKPISFNNYIGDIQFYNISDKKWNLSKDKVINRANYNAISYKDTVFLIGGKQLSKKKSRELLVNQIEVVSLKDLSIKKDKTNPHQAVDFGTVLYDNKIIVFGGSIKKHKNGNIVYSNDIHFYDLETGYWYFLSKMPKGKEVNGIVFKDKLYFFGGFNKKAFTTIESFNLKTGKWKQEGNLFRGMKKPAITKDNDFIYLKEAGKITTFEPKTNLLKEYKVDLNLNETKIHCFNETLYVVGGYHVEDYRKFPSNGFYSINVSEFVKTKPINTKTLTQK
ncbi:kelch repeat-containing protein [Polaribacter sp. Z022]|uniref:Kelch repeat-containing protein n=1 Tax=Polaribacter sp. Z022 TaxID=2927125 RepID=UPI0020206059|nr:kelch repeat-containing protein [Polaribacter sp. Z022]MCL7752524.1 carboxypeptidase-like regulatory domain-containing protein [Polaribacter sp. Z022]